MAGCLAMVNGGMAAWEVELWMADPTLSYTGVAVGHNIAATLFGGTMPLVATFLFYRSDKLVDPDNEYSSFWPRVIPGLYISCLGCLSLFCISYVVRHPHDLRTGDNKLREVVARENQRYRKTRNKKNRHAAVLVDQGFGEDPVKGSYIAPID
jgi:hypothetical protein